MSMAGWRHSCVDADSEAECQNSEEWDRENRQVSIWTESSTNSNYRPGKLSTLTFDFELRIRRQIAEERRGHGAAGRGGEPIGASPEGLSKTDHERVRSGTRSKQRLPRSPCHRAIDCLANLAHFDAQRRPSPPDRASYTERGLSVWLQHALRRQAHSGWDDRSSRSALLQRRHGLLLASAARRSHAHPGAAGLALTAHALFLQPLPERVVQRRRAVETDLPESPWLRQRGTGWACQRDRLVDNLLYGKVTTAGLVEQKEKNGKCKKSADDARQGCLSYLLTKNTFCLHQNKDQTRGYLVNYRYILR